MRMKAASELTISTSSVKRGIASPAGPICDKSIDRSSVADDEPTPTSPLRDSTKPSVRRLTPSTFASAVIARSLSRWSASTSGSFA